MPFILNILMLSQPMYNSKMYTCWILFERLRLRPTMLNKIAAFDKKADMKKYLGVVMN